MKPRYYILIAVFIFIAYQTTFGQGRTTFTGTVLSYGTGLSTRSVTRNFTLRINGISSDDQVKNFISELERGGQDDLLDAIKDQDLGSLSIGGQIGRRINMAWVDDVEGRKKLTIIFERWIGFAELRGGYRSLNYPFSYIELFIDPETGKAEGNYFAAARIRYKNNNVEVEDYATFPSKLLNVRMDGRRLL